MIAPGAIKPWSSRYRITPATARALMEIEGARAVVERLPLSPAAENELRERARVRSTHYSTRIEGNLLTLEEAEAVIRRGGTALPGRERDATEVRNYWASLLRVEEWAAQKLPLTEDLICRLHALVEKGPRARASTYRDGQNVIRDSQSSAIVYLPPEAQDVPGLMAGMVAWANRAEEEGLPVPIIAALVHYQFVTIHPTNHRQYIGNTSAICRQTRGGRDVHPRFLLSQHRQG